MANPIANTICRISCNASDSLKNLNMLLETHQTLKNTSEVRFIMDALEEILLDSSVLKESIGFRVDEWFLDYLTK